jgi:hypothetical protein
MALACNAVLVCNFAFTYYNFQVEIFAVTGQKMATLYMKGGNSSQYIDIDPFTTGIYYYQIMRDKTALQRGNLSILKY